METYSTASSSSSSSPMYLSKYPQEGNSLKASQSFHSSLHSVRKPYQVKPWKKPIAPLPPTPPRVYKVDPINFRDLVQKLTGAPDPSESQGNNQQQRLQRVAPPPLDLDKKPALFSREFATVSAAPLELLPSPVNTPFSALYQELMSDTLPDSKPRKVSDSVMASSCLEFNLLSPSTHNWCSFPLLSPGTLSSLEQSTVL
ncbi:uncharacterized protein LOC8283389 [Ricinus communis]|uniref:VQ domain-containing protein n=1 Tax=Ricinus communis TaxID=3988 RepID=B9SH27_RICCO|nr:uncharacterized protein LOC8283389 [Ricinus communis]EEF37124.1 conserved hypothetical protein [Ricinus communis]|eukprot:XP_002525296.1 uncharacterized protein LOC8283389 [Ricinus communis]